jgi:hypothetical protein
MSFDVKKMASEAALGAVTASLACYGLHQIYPAPSGTFLVVIGAVSACSGAILRKLATEAATMLTKEFKTPNGKFQHLYGAGSIVAHTLLVIFFRYAGQRMGYQVPGLVQTFGYLSLAGTAFAVTRCAAEFTYLHNYPTEKSLF